MNRKKTGRSLPGCIVAGMVVLSIMVPAISGYAEGGKTGSGLAARVNGTAITEKQLQSAIDDYLPGAYYHGNITPEKRAVLRPKALEDLIEKELYLQEAKKIGLTVNKDDLKAELKKIRDRFSSDREFQKALKDSGLTAEGLEETVGNNLLVNRFIDEQITRKSVVTEEYLKDYYEKNIKSFVMPDAYRIRHIVIKVPPDAEREERAKLKKQAEELLARAKKGEDFGELAYKYSMDDWRVKYGDLGLVHKGRLDPDLENAALGLEVGSISDVVATIYGYHIVKLEERVPGKQLSFEEVRDRIKKQAEASRRSEIEADVIKRLKEKAAIELY